MFYSAVRVILGVLSRLLFSVKVEGAENVPAEGPVILCPNHIAWWDAVIIAYALRRPIHFMAKIELYRNPIFAWIMNHLNAFPVDRGKADLSAIRDSISIVRQGKVLGIFPEGHRAGGSGVLGEMHPGAALVALRTRGPVYPIAIRGRYTFRGRIVVRFGEPMVLVGTTGKAAKDLEEGANTIGSAITALWEGLGGDVR